ncbi:MAG: S8 family serine peptidase [Halobacteria archaeon]
MKFSRRISFLVCFTLLIALASAGTATSQETGAVEGVVTPENAGQERHLNGTEYPVSPHIESLSDTMDGRIGSFSDVYNISYHQKRRSEGFNGTVTREDTVGTVSREEPTGTENPTPNKKEKAVSESPDVKKGKAAGTGLTSNGLGKKSEARKKVVIGYKDSSSSLDISSKYGYNSIEKYRSDVVNFETAKLSPNKIQSLREDPAVEYVVEDHAVKALGTYGSSSSGQSTPWGIEKVKARTAEAGISDEDESEINVAVVDTGVDYSHQDLEGSVKWGVDTTGSEVRYGKEAAMDGHGHGTHVSGTVTANDDGNGVVGVAPNVSIYAVQVLNSNGRGTFSDVTQGIEEAHKGPDGVKGTDDDADVISMSLGGSSSVPAMKRAVENASKNIAVISAAGNSGDGDGSTNEIGYPAKYNASMAIAATNTNDGTPTFSSEGEQLDVAAPGVDVKSTYPNDGYRTWSGTSMATPHVSGTAALLLADSVTGSDQDPDLGTQEVRNIMTTTAVDIESEGFDRHSGHGRIDATRVLGDIPIPMIGYSPSTPIAQQTVTFDGSNSTANSTITGYRWTVDGETKTGEKVTHSFESTGNYEVELNITTSEGESGETTKTVEVLKPVVADAGSSKSIEPGETIELNGTGSFHRDGEISSYRWRLNGSGSLKDGNTATPVYTAPESDPDGRVKLSLTVSDGQHTDTDTAYVFVGNGGVWNSFLKDSKNTAYLSGSVGVGEMNISTVLDDGFSYGSTAVTQNTVFQGFTSEKLVKAVNRSSGDVIWSFGTPDPVVSTPAVQNGTVMVLDYSGNLFALDRGTGEVSWNKDLNTDSRYWGSPNIKNGVVYVSGDQVRAYDLETGNKLWSNNRGWGFRRTTPAVNDGVVYDVDFYSEEVMAFDARSGNMIWEKSVSDSFYSSVTVEGGHVYVGSGWGSSGSYPLYALDKQNGALAWKKNLNQKVYASPAVNDGKVFAATLDGNVLAFSSDDGEKLWSFNHSEKPILYSPGLTDGKLFVGGLDGVLSAVNAETGEQVKKTDTRGGKSILSAVSVGLDSVYFSTNEGLEKAAIQKEGSREQVGEAGSIQVSAAGDEWQVVELKNSYDDPVVVTSPVSYSGADPAHVRVRTVRSDSFEIKIEEWDYLNEKHTTETVNYMVFEAGSHKLENGVTVEAGSKSVDHEWSGVDLGTRFTDPVVMSQTTTYLGRQSVVTRHRNVASKGFEVRLQEEEGNNGVHLTEKVDYIAMEGKNVGTGETSHRWTGLGFDDGSTGLKFAESQTYRGNDPGNLRLKNGSVAYEEERSVDNEMSHVREKIGYAEFDPGSVYSQPQQVSNFGEVGSTNVDAAGDWQKVELDGKYTDPVVVTSPLTYSGHDPSHVRVRNVKEDSFEMQIEEWDYLNEKHTRETVNYMVVESGSHELDNGLTLEAGKITADHGWSSVPVALSGSNDPVVLSQVMSFNGADAVVTRSRNVDSNGFDLRLQEEEGNNGVHTKESVGYVAVNGSGVSRLETDHSWRSIEGGGGVAFADVQTFRGNDPVALRMRGGNSVRLEEERSVDEETGHFTEKVGMVDIKEGRLTK